VLADGSYAFMCLEIRTRVCRLNCLCIARRMGWGDRALGLVVELVVGLGVGLGVELGEVGRMTV
jgi:hypothetical protein